MIADSQFDTKPLASMNDIDLHPGCKLPPALPADPEAITDTTYVTCKLTLSMMVRKIISSLFGTTPLTYDAIMKFDAQVREKYDSFPSGIKHAFGKREGGPTLGVQRLGLKVIMCHALIIIHRPFLYRSFRDARYIPSREKCLEAAHQVLELFHDYRNNLDYVEYAWYALGALHAFHAGTVVGLRCYLEPLTCDERDWVTIEKARAEFAKLANLDGWSKLGEKGSKVFGILIRKALEKKAILESALGTDGVTIGPSGHSFEPRNQGYDNTVETSVPVSIPTAETTTSSSGAPSVISQYSTPLFGTTNQYDVNPLTNPALHAEAFNPAQLQGVGMPGIVAFDSSPGQGSWDALFPKSMNLVCCCDL
jgi:hypothetical protein